MTPRPAAGRFTPWARVSYGGLVVAALAFAASLTPSLLPRLYLVQGLLSGFALALGYGVGVAGVWAWTALELPRPDVWLDRLGRVAAAALVAVTVVAALWSSTVWQNSIRELMELPPVETAYPWRVAAVALVTGTLLLGLARGLGWCWACVHARVTRFVPRRVAVALSTLLVGLLLVLVVNHVLARLALDAADAVFLEIDKWVEEGIARPTHPLATGSAESLVDWDSIGRQGKRFLVTGPDEAALAEFAADPPPRRPLRVYAGLRSAETIEARADLALRELIRVGGFERSVLIVATPTGTGWLDPGAVDTVEYLHHGDTAIVSMQYSYLPSWLTIFVDPHRSRDAARALFNVVYAHWRGLPRERRPRLYLHGLSLGSLGSEASADLFTLFEDPIQGGVWSGPPFPSPVWNSATRARNPDSPVWLPRFRDGALLRFTGRKNALDQGGARWSAMRFVYIQYPSDPIVFFSPEMFVRRPEWLSEPRGPDVSPHLRWYPVITGLQTAFDIPMATTVPHGYGHNYAAGSYLDAWIAVTSPAGWDAGQTARLLERLARAPQEPE